MPASPGAGWQPAGRVVIDQYQPLLGLFGHIHEAKGAVRLGRTLCINPGSVYEQGRLLGALVKWIKHKIKNYILTTGKTMIYHVLKATDWQRAAKEKSYQPAAWPKMDLFIAAKPR